MWTFGRLIINFPVHTITGSHPTTENWLFRGVNGSDPSAGLGWLNGNVGPGMWPTERRGPEFRSGWSVDPLTGVYTGFIRSPTGIPADPALTSHGVSQSKEMGKHLMTLDPPIDAVYSSPYYRCLQTITPFVELKQQQLNDQPGIRGSAAARIRPEHGIGEFFGAAPFDHPTPAPSKRLKELFPAFDEDYSSAITPSRKGETINDLYGRVAAAVQAIIERCDAEGHRAVVLCTHAAVVITLGRILTGRIPKAVEEEDFHAFTCGLSTYRRRGPGLERTTMLGPSKFVR
ncbi:transcription initiation factor [Fusarium phyllophilum]|uniref:Transcription initiation factor n=1 Tax=Fusarium phyllophilum TaxID=47803 RepID=A0A8H5NLI6_9HYPO|nr:transcription initiation factor [Fusarium phyllophilum]